MSTGKQILMDMFTVPWVINDFIWFHLVVVIIDSYWFFESAWVWDLLHWIAVCSSFSPSHRCKIICIAYGWPPPILDLVLDALLKCERAPVLSIRVYPGWFSCLCSLWCTLQDIAKHDVNLWTFVDPEFRTPSSGGSKGDLLSKLANEPSQRLPEQEVAVIATWHTHRGSIAAYRGKLVVV